MEMRRSASEDGRSGLREAATADDSHQEASPGLQIYNDGTGYVIEVPVRVDSELDKLWAVAAMGLDLTMFGMMLCGGVLGVLHNMSQVPAVAESAVRHAAFLAAF